MIREMGEGSREEGVGQNGEGGKSKYRFFVALR